MNLKGRKFENERLGMEIYVYDINEKEWFIGKDIAKMLGYKDPSATLRDNVNKTYKNTMYIKTIENIGNGENTHSEFRTINNNLTLINEFGLYQLVCSSKKSEAIEFQKWIYEEVLPSIRKNNYYYDNENINEEQIKKLESEINRLKIEKGILHEIVYDMTDATTISFTEVSKKLFNKDAKYLKKLLIEHGFLGEDGVTVLKREAKFITPSGEIENKRLFTTSNVEKCRKEDDIKYNKITNFGYMYLKKYFNSQGLSDFNFK